MDTQAHLKARQNVSQTIQHQNQQPGTPTRPRAPPAHNAHTTCTQRNTPLARHEHPTPAPTPTPDTHKLSPKKVWKCRRVFLLRRCGVPSVGWV
nr:MAG TPA: hypothetical protein [Caudoviricetes sp.]